MKSLVSFRLFQEKFALSGVFLLLELLLIVKAIAGTLLTVPFNAFYPLLKIV